MPRVVSNKDSLDLEQVLLNNEALFVHLLHI